EDVAHVDLLHDLLFLLGAHLVELDDVDAGGRAQRRADLARLEAENGAGEEGRQLRALAPAEGAALEGILAVGIRDGELAEILALARTLINVLGALLRLGDLLRGR